MSKKLSHASYLQIVKEFNDLLKKNNIDKTEYIKPVSNILCYSIDDVVEGKKKFDILMCPICLNILNDPISCNSTEKSHSFCKQCIEQSLKSNDKCPICREKITDSVILKNVNANPEDNINENEIGNDLNSPNNVNQASYPIPEN